MDKYLPIGSIVLLEGWKQENNDIRKKTVALSKTNRKIRVGLYRMSLP